MHGLIWLIDLDIEACLKIDMIPLVSGWVVLGSENLLKKKETVASKIPSSRVALAGFDMGGALAFFTALTHRKRLAGAAGIGAWIPLQPRITDEYSTKNKEMQVLLQHGEEDIIVPFDYAFPNSDDFLKKLGQPFGKHTYKGVKHDWTGQIEKDLVAYLQQVLPENSDSSSKTSASKKQHEDL